MQLEQLDPKILGQRLTDAREAQGVGRRSDAAKHLECSRPTFIAIEKGNPLAEAGRDCCIGVASTPQGE